MAHFVLGLAVNEVSILPGEDWFGEVASPSVLGYETGSRRAQRQVAREIIVGCYAGMEAELMFDPQAPDGASADDANAFDVSREYGVMPRGCSWVGDDAHRAYLRRLRGEARRLVRRHWRAVEQVAASLLTNKRLDKNKLKELQNALFP